MCTKTWLIFLIVNFVYSQDVHHILTECSRIGVQRRLAFGDSNYNVGFYNSILASPLSDEARMLCDIIIMGTRLRVDGQKDKQFFRKDYTYIEGTESFYKIHTLHKTWSDAKRLCALEGASLFYPDNESEAHAVISFWNSTQPFLYMFVGISDLLVKGVFETIDGHPVSDVYNQWGPGEPNDAGGIEDCVILRKDGSYNDDNCNKKLPFICKKSLPSLEWNHQCDLPNLDYIYNAELGRCYKFHKTPLNWTDAYAACSAEQSYLAVINTQLEANYFVRLTENKTKDKVSGNQLNGAVHLGFHNRVNEGWKAVRGTSLDDTGYVCWGKDQPDGGDNEQCGSMFYNGLLNDISCDTRCFFICEHEVDSFSSLFDDRFGEK